MNDTPETQEPALVTATLIHGQSYTVGKTKFEFNTPKIVTQEMADYLEENAVYSARQDQGGRTVRKNQPKFSFAVVEEDDEPAAEPEADKTAAPSENAAKPKTRQRGKAKT